MSASNSTPYGLKSLLECLSRAALVGQLHDIPGFLCAHVTSTIKSSDEESRDIKEVVFWHQCQWEQTFFKDKRNWRETPKPSPEESLTPTSSESSAASVSPVPSPPSEDNGPSVRTPSQCESVCPTAEEENSHSSKLSCALSERIPSQMEAALSLPPPWPVLPPICQKPSKQNQGQKSTKECICCLTDRPYHNKDTESSPADQSLGPVSTSTGPAAKKDLGPQKSKAEPGPFEIPFPYRPKGGYIVDPELEPKKARMTTVESALLFGRQSIACGMQGNVLEGINLSQVSVETSPYTCSHSKPNAHIFKYRDLHVRCSQVQPHSGKLRDITVQPNLEHQHDA